MQPRGQRLPRANGSSTSDQRQKHRLERVFRVGVVRQKVSANRPDERAVPTNQFLERPLIAVLFEPVEQVGIGRSGVRQTDDGMHQRRIHHI